MATLARERCLNHPAREAVCRCPSCHNFFCRECVALFESRLLCAHCLAAEVNAQDSEISKRGPNIGAIAFAVLGFLLIWMFFYFAGWSLLQLREHTVASASISNPLAEL